MRQLRLSHFLFCQNADGLKRESENVMKKVALLILSIAILMCLVACSQGQDQTPAPTPEHTHSFGEWSISKNPTCAEDGVKVRYCDCGEKQSESIPILNHTEVIDEAVAPTCTAVGKTEGKHCSTCNQVIVAQSEIAKVEHTYSGDFDATCEVCGFTRDVDCSHTKVTILPAKDATCSETGLTEGKHCNNCDTVLVKQEIVPTLPHTYGDWVTTKVANCGQDGEMTRYCNCGAKQTEVVSGSGMHGEVIDPAVAPTCSTTGLTEGKHCPYCNTVFVVQEVIPTVDHVYNTTYSFDDSFHWYACENCGTKKDIAEHQVAENGACIVCEHPVGPTVGIIYDISADGTYAEVVGYEGTATKIKIADTYKGLPVTIIYDKAFYGNDTITTVIIPDSVTSVGEEAFQFCSSLTSVVIGDSVASIGELAFYFCTSLSSVVIPDSVTSIGYGAFWNCQSLASVVIPDSVTSIGGSAFIGCYKLQFNEYENCKYFGSKDNPYFALIEVTTQNLSSYTIHEDTKVIADSAFANCARLTTIVIPDSVTSIGTRAFSGCSSLTLLVIGNSVTSIGDSAFSNCTSLTSVVIGNSVTSIGSSAFYYCSNLKDVYYTGSEEEWKAIEIDSNSNAYLTKATIYYNYVPEN